MEKMRGLPLQPGREITRWAVIVSTGGLGLYLLASPLFAWLRPGGNVYFFIGELMIFGPVSLPFLLIAYSLLERAYASVVEVVASVVGIAAFGLCGNLSFHTGLTRRAVTADAGSGWWMAVNAILLFVTGFLPLIIGIIVYRLCCRAGYRYAAPERLNRQPRVS